MISKGLWIEMRRFVFVQSLKQFHMVETCSSQLKTSLIGPTTSLDQFDSITIKKTFCQTDGNHSWSYRLHKLVIGYLAPGYIARDFWLYSHWLYSQKSLAIQPEISGYIASSQITPKFLAIQPGAIQPEIIGYLVAGYIASPGYLARPKTR